MKRITVILFSLLIALLLAGLCSCKQEVTPEADISEGAETAALNPGISGVSIPEWEKSTSGLQDLPDAVLSGTGTGVSAALKTALLNPPALKDAHFLIVMVCEGLTSELIESSYSKYGEILLQSFPVKGTTKSVFTSSSDQLLVDYVRHEQDKTVTGLTAYGDLASNSMRRMTTTLDNDADPEEVYKDEFILGPPLKFFLGKGDFDALVDPSSPYHKNEVYKSHGKKAESFADAVALYDTVTTFEHGSDVEEGTVKKLFAIIKDSKDLPSFRQEMAFSLAWMQNIMDEDGFCLLSTYSPASALDELGVQEFDEGVAVAVKYVLENPNTALLVFGCPADGSEADVCFFGLGKDMKAESTAFDCVSALFE